MSIEQVRHYLSRWSKDKDIIEMDISTATVELAAAAVGVIPARIAKSISLRGPELALSTQLAQGTQLAQSSDSAAMIVVVAGDVKIDNQKFRSCFNLKARMLNPEEVLKFTGHAIGGVCPFALPPKVDVYLDDSMKRFTTVFPACGSSNSCIELTLPELEEYSHYKAWIDVCKPIAT
ncbi:MAG: YbaK/EbsC family protein [Treponema sp.]|nr:YbaK/EbsC family protein [Treponema sp.]